MFRPRRTGLKCVVLGVVAWFVWLACAGTQQERRWLLDVARVDRLVDDERYDEAMTAYEALLPHAPTDMERRYIVRRMGRLEERLGHYEEALELYLSLLDHHELWDPLEDHTPTALFRIGLILYDEFGDEEQGLEMWRLVVRHYPSAEGPAHRALDGIIVHFERYGLHEEAVRYFASEFRQLQDTRMGDNMLYWLAYWYRHYLDEPDYALELFLRLRAEYFDVSTLRDEGDWEIVELLHEREEYERELKFLYELREEREESIILGPSVTPNMENAAFRAGWLRLEFLDDPGGAIEEWEKFLDVWQFSLMRDDAVLGIIRAAEELGDPRLVRRWARHFLVEYSDSRYVDEVAAILSAYEGDRGQ